jgi:hypothetical protein
MRSIHWQEYVCRVRLWARQQLRGRLLGSQLRQVLPSEHIRWQFKATKTTRSSVPIYIHRPTAPRPRDIPCSHLLFSHLFHPTRHSSSRICYLHTRFPDDVVGWCGRRLDGGETTPLLPQILISSLFYSPFGFSWPAFMISFAISRDRDDLSPPPSPLTLRSVPYYPLFLTI